MCCAVLKCGSSNVRHGILFTSFSIQCDSHPILIAFLLCIQFHTTVDGLVLVRTVFSSCNSWQYWQRLARSVPIVVFVRFQCVRATACQMINEYERWMNVFMLFFFASFCFFSHTYFIGVFYIVWGHIRANHSNWRIWQTNFGFLLKMNRTVVRVKFARILLTLFCSSLFLL